VSLITTANRQAAVQEDPQFMALMGILIFGLIDRDQRISIGGVVGKEMQRRE
jgi:hypothetical protein